MDELAGIIKTTEKDRQKYIKQLLKVRQDPVREVKKLKLFKNIMFILSWLGIFAIISFQHFIGGLIRDIALCIFAISASIAVMYGMLIKNIPLGLEFFDWEKVEHASTGEQPPPLPSTRQD